MSYPPEGRIGPENGAVSREIAWPIASENLAICRLTVTNPVRVDVQVRLGAPDSQRLLQILDLYSHFRVSI